MRYIWSIVLVALLGFSGWAAEWQVDKDADNLVKFTSEVIILSFDGVTDNIDGFLYWEGEQMFEKNVQLHFEVDLNTLDTGIGKRDRDMREVLETDQWPYSIYDGTVKDFREIDSTVTAYRVTVSGTMSIHGVDRELEVPGIVAAEGDNLHVTSNFVIKLSDYDIEAPSLAAFIKVSNEIELTLDFYLKEVGEK